GVMPSRAATFSVRLFTSVRLIPLTCSPNSIFSRTVARNSIGRCSTSVTWRRAGPTGVTAAPSSRTRPWVGRSSRASSRSSVLLPEPFGPTTAMAAPGGTANRSRWSTTRPSYSCRTSISSSMAAALERLQRDVHEQREEQEDQAEREGQAEVPLAGVQRDRGGRTTPGGEAVSQDYLPDRLAGVGVVHDGEVRTKAANGAGREHEPERDPEQARGHGRDDAEPEGEQGDAVHLGVTRNEQRE